MFFSGPGTILPNKFQQTNVSVSNMRQNDKDFDPDEPLPPGFESQVIKKNTSVSFEDRLHMHQSFNPKKIDNELTNQDTYYSEEESEEVMPKPKRAEIAPPTQMDYYNSARNKGPKARKGNRTGDEMAEAFLCGLQNSINRKRKAEDESSDSD